MKILAITGPAGAGKTTISNLLAKELGNCVNIEADHVKHMIVDGFVKDASNAGGWTFTKWAQVGESIVVLAQNFIANGYSVIINGYIGEESWNVINKNLTLDYAFLLLPNIAVNTQRDTGREAHEQMGSAAITEHQEHFINSNIYKNFTRLDTSTHSPEQTAQIIFEYLK